ncbi:hypothetical protein BZA70DRAFT_242056, partial [Myxozyma melibiosi]
PSLKNFITNLETCPQEDLARHIEDFGILWNQPRGDLHHWITVLNRFDDILEHAVTVSGLRGGYPTAYIFPEDEEKKLVAILDFSALLLEHCSHRSLYASGSHLSSLLYVNSLPILLSNLKVCARLAQRYAQSSSGRSSIFTISQEKMFRLANAFPPQSPLEFMSKISLFKFVDENELKWHKSWSTIILPYYKDTPTSAGAGHPETPSHPTPATPTPQIYGPQQQAELERLAAENSDMMSLVVTTEDIEGLSEVDLLNKVLDVPYDTKADAFLRMRTAKSFTGGMNGVVMRRQLIAVKCLAIEFLTYLVTENVLQNKLFAQNPTLIPSLCELIHPDNKVPVDLRTITIEALQAVSVHRSKHNEILSSLSANVNHGVLLYIVRQVVKDLENGEIINCYFSDRLFYLIQVLSASGQSAQVLVSAGIVPVLIQLLRTNSKDYSTMSMITGVTQHMVMTSQAAFSEFVTEGGLDIVVKRVEDEVAYALENQEDVEHSALVDYKMDFMRAHLLKSLFKLLLAMMQSPGNADRMRNLVESSLLESLKTIILNTNVFGSVVVFCAVDMMSCFIHNEPTSYTIINESGLPEIFLDCIPQLIQMTKSTAIPHAIGAICLNNSGLEMVQKKGAIKTFFSVFKNRERARMMALSSVPGNLGNAIDELVRHQPTLKDEIMKQVVMAAKDICVEGESIPGGVRFYPVGADAVQTDADDELVVQDANSDIMALIECYARFLESLFQNGANSKEFVRREGATHLLKMFEIPSLPYDFALRGPAISLSRVFRSISESNTYLMMSKILRALTETMKKIKTFLDFAESESIFEYLAREGENPTEFLRALNGAHGLIFIVSQMYSHTVYPHAKSTLPMIQPFETESECANLLEELGKLQRNCLWEDICITKGLSDEWRDASRVLAADDPRGRLGETEKRAEIAEAEAKIDVTDNKYKNVKIARYMMSQIPSSISKIFIGISKWALSRRVPDVAQKKYGFAVADKVAKVFIAGLEFNRLECFEDKRDKFAYWLLSLSSSRNILFDGESSRISSASLQTVTVICFKRAGGLDVLIKVLEGLWYEMNNVPSAEDGEKSLLSKQAMTFGDVVVLQIFSALVGMKSVIESSQTSSLASKERDRNRPDYFNPAQFLVELRLTVLPVIRKLWESEELKTVSTPILKMLMSILMAIMNADGETGCLSKEEGREWSSDQLTSESFVEETAFRPTSFLELGFSRPIEITESEELEDEVVPRAVEPEARVIITTDETSEDAAESPSIHSSPAASAVSREEGPVGTPENGSAAGASSSRSRSVDVNNGSIREDDMSDDREDTPVARESASTPAPGEQSERRGEEPGPSASDEPVSEKPMMYVSDLNAMRDEIRKDIIARSLQALNTHPDVVFETSKLLMSAFSGKLFTGEARKKAVVEILAFIAKVNEEEDEKARAIKLKTNAHLLGLLLQSDLFFDASVNQLLGCWNMFVGMIRLDPNNEDSWLPDILLIVEKCLSSAEQPKPIILEHNLTGPIVNRDQLYKGSRETLLDAIVNLPEMKTEANAAAVARVLIALTRDHKIAVKAFERGAITSLLKSIGPLHGEGRIRIQNYITILFRHVMEEPETLEALMLAEARKIYLEQADQLHPTDAHSLIRASYLTILRSPETYVKVVNENFKAVWIPELPAARQDSIMLKSREKETSKPDSSSAEGDGETAEKSGEPATETKKSEDEEMTDAKPSDPGPARVLSTDKNTGVINFLLNELLATKDDPPENDGNTPEPPEDRLSDSNQRSQFDPEKHPQFLYRTYLLEVITELLSSYNQCKLEFISYSRRGHTISTPSKPRHAVLNYFLNELVSTSTIYGMGNVAIKMKSLISSMASRLLYALISSTQEYEADSDNGENLTITHIRKFVLDATLRAFKDVSTSSEPAGVRYARLVSLGTLCNRFLYSKGHNSGSKSDSSDDMSIAKIMFEKNFVGALTSTLNEVDLNIPSSQKVIRVLLRPLSKLSRTSIELSNILEMAKPTEINEEDYFSTDSDEEDYREETPNFFTNSALGMFEVQEGMDYDEEDSEGSEIDDQGEEMEFDEEEDDDEPHSDDDEEDSVDETMEYGDEEMEYGDEEDDSELSSDEEDDDDDDGEEDENEISNSELEQISSSEIDEADGYLGGEEDEEVSDDEIEVDDEEGSSGMEDYDEILSWQMDGEEDEIDRETIDQLAREIREDIDEVQAAMDEEDDEDGEIDGGDESVDSFLPELESFEEGWELEEVMNTEDSFNRRNHHVFGSSSSRNRSKFKSSSEQFSLVIIGTNFSCTGWSGVDTATNPLLVPSNNNMMPAFGGRPGTQNPDGLYRAIVQTVRRGGGSTTSHDLQTLNDLFQQVLRQQTNRRTTMLTGSDPLANELEAIYDIPQSRARQLRDDAFGSLISFVTRSTVERWHEESRMLFPNIGNDKVWNILNHILNYLVPLAQKEYEKKKEIEAAERRRSREQLEKERQEQQAAKMKDQIDSPSAADHESEEEKEQGESSEQTADEPVSAPPATESNTAESEAAEPEAVEAEVAETVDADEEASEPETTEPEISESAQTNTERIIVTVGGQEVDITDSGIDPEFLEALPDDMREEVITAHLRELQRSSSTARVPEPESEIEAEFLAALPPSIREELLREEASERRRAAREREAREAAASQQEAPAEEAQEDMDYESFLATLDPALRQTILAEQDEDVLAQLPQNIAEEAHEIQRRHNLHSMRDYLDVSIPTHRLNAIRNATRGALPRQEVSSKPQRNRNGIQLLDRSGIASLVRLLYLPQTTSQRNPLFEMLLSVTANRQSRSELFNMILSILHDGSTDVAAVERSFNQIAARARPQQTASVNTPVKSSSLTPKTPMTPVKQGASGLSGKPVEVSPISLVQQCLEALDYILKANRQLASYFLIEHDSPIGLKRSLSRKGKSKDLPVSKASKYPINTLLDLLDRQMIRDNAGLMDMISMLLQEITRPLQVVLKKSQEKSAIEEKATGTTTGDAGDSNDAPATAGESEATKGEMAGESSDNQNGAHRKFVPPFIPEQNLCSLVNILTARECPNRTLQQTMAAMQNLSAVPGAIDVFGKELIRQAQALGQALPVELKELAEQIRSAKTGSEVQGMALSRFSLASSDQAKLLRVLTAVDYLFDNNRDKKASDSASDSGDALIELYSKLDFKDLWDALGQCLYETQERPDMLHVATVLLPLIEAFMVVCKREVVKETEETPTIVALTGAATSTSPSDVASSDKETKAHLFFQFTDENRKILNQMVRNNPKLMSGSFSILVKNPKVLDFDNKRNFFYRQLHLRAQNARIHQPFVINVRRDQVFLDSYKAMYFMSGDEIKYSKLNIRFHGEEGVDAGGVTREWFQVLARQMFNPDYALFAPVASDRTTFHPNRTSWVNPEHLLFFKFVGRIIGKALYEGRVLDCHFSRAVYKRMLGRQVALKDMENLDLEYYKSLVWMLENDITDVITETMSLEADDYGDKKIIDLIPNGREIAVTEENKNEYVRLVVGYRLLTSVQEQLDSFLKGFYDIVPADLISIFNENELELLISGLPDIDVDDWRNNTVYQNYSASSPQIQWFWRAVRSFDLEERANLLQFVTGTSKVPLNGFAELEGMNGVSRFSIHRDYGRKERLPSSHTCFNQLDMPEYDSYEALRTALLMAITEGTEGFGFA